MKKWNYGIVIGMSMVLSMSVLSGCGDKKNEDSSTTTEASENNQTADTNTESENNAGGRKETTESGGEEGNTQGNDKTENSQEQKKKIEPISEDISVDQLDNCTVAAAFSGKDLSQDADGNWNLHFEVYDYENFDAGDIGQMQAGDVLVIGKKEVPVTSVEREDSVVKVNGGVDAGGINLMTEDQGGIYFENLMDTADVVHQYQLLGETTLPVDASFVCQDSADLEKGEQTYTAQELQTMAENEEFVVAPTNGTVRIENGKVVEIIRRYVP